MIHRKAVPLEKSYLLLNHGPVPLISSAHGAHIMRFVLCLLSLFILSSPVAFASSMGECESVIREGNEANAYNHCLRAAKEGNPKAQVVVGMALMSGVGVFKDPAGAVGWFSLAAEQKYPSGIYNLALAKIAGLGTPQDETDGMALMQKAADSGDVRAREFLEQVGAQVPQQKSQYTRKRQLFDCTGVGCGKPIDGQPR